VYPADIIQIRQPGFGNGGDTCRDYVYGKKCGIVIFLENAEPVAPFDIDKAGFGAMSAWLCVDDINDIKIN
jgi:hypothetical protein